jgi:putative endonuclease
MSEFFVYILANRYRGTMYVGVTNDLSRRVGEHKSGAVPGFTKRYKIDQLVYCEPYASIDEARAREHVLKRWRREWKFELIEA